MAELPKYFKNLHLAVSTITGTPRIVSIDFSKTDRSDKFIDIPKEEFESCILNHYDHLPENSRHLMIMKNWTGFLGFNTTSKENLIKCLEEAIEEVKALEDKDETHQEGEQ